MESTRLSVRSLSTSKRSAVELWLRYGAAMATTLLAVAGAQLVTRTDFCLLLAVVTIIGVPVSLWLRQRDLYFGSVPIHRTVWNALITLLTFVAAIFFVFYTFGDAVGLILHDGFGQRFWMRFGASEPLILLIQLFSLFGAFRSFGIITDKDATLTTVPSFSVLLLLIPVHKGLEVVIYFLLWTFVAALLFALDHRAEQRERSAAVIEAPSSGQGEKLAARSLASVLGIALLGAVGVSVFLTSRDADQKSSAETAITSLASRLSQFAFAMPDQATTFGAERQIDFSSGPALPSERPLWQMRAVTLDGRVVQPDYWRLFTLSNYTGTSWVQINKGQYQIKRQQLVRKDWPLPAYVLQYEQQARRVANRQGLNYGFGRRGTRGIRLNPSRQIPTGFRVSKILGPTETSYGAPLVPTRQLIVAQAASLGYVPLLPAARTLVLPDSDQSEVRTRADGAIDVGVVQTAQAVRCLSFVPALPEYGFAGHRVPMKNVHPVAGAPQLSAAERELNLNLPPSVTSRVRDFAASVLKRRIKNESNMARAQRLAFAIQNGATYTLRPPAIPEGRDAADFFLFDGNRRGYCTYFAGALAVVCRTQDIPARVVSGFATPQFGGDGIGLIKEANAHAWTEVWVDNWGWAVVDATPATDRGDNAPGVFENWSDLMGAWLDNGLRWVKHYALALSYASTLLFMLAVAWRKRGTLGLAALTFFSTRSPEPSQLERRVVYAAYAQASRMLERRFRPRFAWETPQEWLAAARVALPQASLEGFERLTQLYSRARFSSHSIDSKLARQAQSEVAKLRFSAPKKAAPK